MALEAERLTAVDVSGACGPAAIGTVRVQNISRRSKQGDVKFLEVLARMGAAITDGPDWIEVAALTSTLQGVDVDLRDIPDTAQTGDGFCPHRSARGGRAD